MLDPYVCAYVFEQGLNGTAVLYHHWEKNNEAVIRGPLRSEKEALLLGNYMLFLLYIAVKS